MCPHTCIAHGVHGDPSSSGGTSPASFYFTLLSRSITLELSEESQTSLREHVASHLQFARVDDLPLPEQDAGRSITNSPEVRAMESIASNHVSMQRRGAEAVAELWDRYLVQIVGDLKLRPERLAELTSVVSTGDWKSHDYHIYEAINTYLMDYPGLSEEKALLYGHLDCQKLSHEACIQTVQNKRLSLVVG